MKPSPNPTIKPGRPASVKPIIPNDIKRKEIKKIKVMTVLATRAAP
jgi:hypothetical protein